MENRGWKDGAFFEIANITMGQSPNGDTCNNYEGIPLLNGPTEFGIKYPKEIQYTLDSKRECKPMDILFCVRGSTTGKMNWADKKYSIGRGLAAINHKNGHEYNNFVKGVLDYNLDLLLASATGSTFPNISRNQLENLQIKLPPLTEQKAIASVLSSLDDKIELLHKQNQTLEALAETLFRQWFIEEAKEDWEEGTVGDLSIHTKISVHPKKNPDTLYHHYSIPSFDANKKPIVELGADIQSNKYKVEAKSILFSKLNPHKDKRVWLILDDLQDNSICSTEFQVVKPTDDIYLYFIYGCLTHSAYYNEIASGVGGTSGSHQRIDPKSIFNAPCIKIDKQIIADYNVQIAPLFKKQFSNQQQIQTLTKLRDTLLPKLMSGEVRVKI